jgi:magnesium chelatase family protein
MPLHRADPPALHFQNLRTLLDRIDIHIDVPAVNYKEMRSGAEAEPSEKIRDRVVCARHIQQTRFAKEGIFCNAQMAPRQMRTYCDLSADCEKLLERAMLQQGLSARAHDRILKVARTIADLEAVEHLETKHIAEAIQYRTLDRTYLGIRFAATSAPSPAISGASI